MRISIASLISICLTVGLLGLADTRLFAHGASQSDTAGAVAASTHFFSLLARGDSAGAATLLAADAVILESGDMETRAEYLAHHIGADIEFAKAVPSKRTIRRIVRQGDMVWLAATSTSTGTFENRPLDLSGAELMVLSTSDSVWRIRAIHWSSHKRK